MKNIKFNKYDNLAKVIGITIGIILIIGISYAAFRRANYGEEDNTIQSGKLDVRVENEQNEINFDDTLPMLDEKGMRTTPYTFDIVNHGIEAMYDMYLEIDEDTTIPVNRIRYYLIKEVDGSEEPVDLEVKYVSDCIDSENKGKKLYKLDINDSILINHPVSYKLYMWLAIETTKEEVSNMSFSSNIRVDASQVVKREKPELMRKVDVSANGTGDAYIYVYNNGTVKIEGKGELSSNISDMDIYRNAYQLDDYKEVLRIMGCDVDDSITTDDQLEEYKSQLAEEIENFDDRFEQACDAFIVRKVLESMGYSNLDSIVDYDTGDEYLIENGILLDESWSSVSEDGDIFLQKYHSASNNFFSEKIISINNIELSEGITNIPEGLYTANEDLLEIEIPSTIVSINDRAFMHCNNLKKISIKNSSSNQNNIKYIGKYAISYCKKLSSIEIIENSKLISIDDNAFCNCSDLTSVILPNSVTKIGTNAFESCSNLETITLSNNLTSISKSAFRLCSNLSSIVIPDSVTEIGITAFEYCRSLSEITTSNSVTEIGASAFNSCSSLSTITIPNSVTKIGDSAFSSCTNLETVILSNNITAISNNLFIRCSNLNLITIPDSVTEIGTSAFDSCSSLSTITIPNSVIEIGSLAFSGCKSLTRIDLPDNMTVISSSLFNSCINLTSVVIPEGVTSIGNNAFYSCSKLTTITIPNTVTFIGNKVFYSCTELVYVEIPSSVLSIGNKAFMNLGKFSKIYCENDTVAALLEGKYTSPRSTVIVDPTKFA